MASVDYYQITSDLADLLKANVPEAKFVWIEGMEREVGNIAHMPLINVRLQESNEELTGIPDGTYEHITLYVDIIAIDFSSFKDAAIIRGSLLASAKNAVRNNRLFTSGVNTSSVTGQTTFGAAGTDDGRGHIAMATFTVIVQAYV